MNVEEIFQKLVGDFSAHGDTYYDDISSKNMRIAEELLNYIVVQLDNNLKGVRSPQLSVKRIATESYNILHDIHSDLDYSLLKYKKDLYRDNFESIKIRQIDKLPNIYIIEETDYVISPFDMSYTLEWYNKYTDSDSTNIESIILYTDKISIDGKIKLTPKYRVDDKSMLYWEIATPEEIKLLGKNILVQPNSSQLGTVRNFYGDIYTSTSLYTAIEKYKDITEPMILCSREW